MENAPVSVDEQYDLLPTQSSIMRSITMFVTNLLFFSFRNQREHLPSVPSLWLCVRLWSDPALAVSP
jgi:hypothetical protein